MVTKNPMTAEQKAQWVNALRSGNYTQGTGCLKYENQHGTRFCCLGVAADLFGVEPRVHKTMLRGFLPGYIQDYLADMNDDGVTFEEIADFIENTLKPE